MKQRLAKLVFGVVFGVLVAALVAEIAIRLMVRQGTLPNRMVADIFAAHAIGWTLEPGLDARIYSTNGMVDIHVNDAGFRDKDYQPAADRPRVLVLGDSFTLAVETAQQDTFHVQLEDHYAGAVDVITMGASGYEIVQEYLAYQHIGRSFAPDIVLVMLYVGNDLDGNRTWTDLPHYTLDDDGALVLHNFPYEGAFNLPLVTGQRSTPLMKKSRLAFLVGTIVRSRQQNTRLADDICGYQRAENFPDPQPDDWRLAEALLLAFRDAVEADGRQFRVAIIPTEFQVEDAYLDDYLAGCELPDWAPDEPYQARLVEFFAANDITYLDLREPLRAARQASGKPLYLSDADIHWTRAGHGVVADVLYEWLAVE
jgi:hypothetical protein